MPSAESGIRTASIPDAPNCKDGWKAPMALHQEFSNGLILAWPTPILSRRLDDSALLSGLKDVILAREKADPKGIRKALVKGWHSETDLMDWPDAPVAGVKPLIGEMLKEYLSALNGGQVPAGNAVVTAWANVSRRGGYHRMHTHHSSLVSGVLYIDVGERDEDDTDFNGTLSFVDPRTAVEMIQFPGEPFGDKIVIDPKPGLIVMFPSWLKHFVDPFRGEGTRISIAFNISFHQQTQAAAPATHTETGE